MTLTIKEAAEYSNIGINKIDSMLKQPNCPFVLYVGTRKLVKRREFEDYIRQTDTTTRAMRWGTEKEEEARDLYASLYKVHVVELGSCRHPYIPNFASSPDGFSYDEDSVVKTCLEIKCPVQSTFMRYVHEVHDNATLLRAKPEYFYQCMAHMMVTGAAQTDFIVYCPWQLNPLHVSRITADGMVFSKMEKRIGLANAFIDSITSKLKGQTYE